VKHNFNFAERVGLHVNGCCCRRRIVEVTSDGVSEALNQTVMEVEERGWSWFRRR
jgi:hypothetical protein